MYFIRNRVLCIYSYAPSSSSFSSVSYCIARWLHRDVRGVTQYRLPTSATSHYIVVVVTKHLKTMKPTCQDADSALLVVKHMLHSVVNKGRTQFTTRRSTESVHGGDWRHLPVACEVHHPQSKLNSNDSNLSNF